MRIAGTSTLKLDVTRDFDFVVLGIGVGGERAREGCNCAVWVGVACRAVDYTILRHRYRMQLFGVQNQEVHQRSLKTQLPRHLINL